MSLKVGSVVGLLASALFAWLALSGSSQIVFADVAEQARKIDTIRYLFKRVYFEELPAGGVTAVSRDTGEYTMRSDVHRVAAEEARALEEELLGEEAPEKRKELIARIEILRAHTAIEQPMLEHSVRVIAARGGKERREPIFPPMDSISISNAQTGLNVALDERRRELVVIRQIAVDADGSESELEGIQNDAVQQILRVPEDGVEQLPNKTINGVRVIGFRHQSGLNGGRVQKDYWVEPDSKLPVQIETRFFEGDESKPSIYSVYWGFVFNEPVEDELFSTVAPEGYEHRQAEVRFRAAEDDASSAEEDSVVEDSVDNSKEDEEDASAPDVD